MTDVQPDPSELPDDDEVVVGEFLDATPAAEDGASPLEEEISVETLVTDLERLAGEREQFLDAYRRTQADFENFRKQSQRRQDELVQRMVDRKSVV